MHTSGSLQVSSTLTTKPTTRPTSSSSSKSKSVQPTTFKLQVTTSSATSMHVDFTEHVNLEDKFIVKRQNYFKYQDQFSQHDSVINEKALQLQKYRVFLLQQDRKSTAIALTMPLSVTQYIVLHVDQSFAHQHPASRRCGGNKAYWTWLSRGTYWIYENPPHPEMVVLVAKGFEDAKRIKAAQYFSATEGILRLGFAPAELEVVPLEVRLQKIRRRTHYA